MHPDYIATRSTITCPTCGFERTEAMADNACEIAYRCLHCSTLLRAKPGDCCVFCSYGSVPCPPIQRERSPTG